ncbi:MAG: porin [Gammaproteobacteria bacterium]|nr:porin [Gammaproteobacteria bacterium]
MMLISRTRLAAAVFLPLCLSVAPMTASAAKFKVKDGPTLDIFGFAQLGFEQYDRPNSSRDNLEFDTDRVRFGTKAKWGAWDGALHFDGNTNRSDTSGRTSLDRKIRDAFIRYKFSDAAQIKVGQYKTPIGMGFNISGTRLPLVKRTMASRLVLDRTIGAMMSGRHIGGSKETGGFGYDIGVFNSADRSPAGMIDRNQKGEDHSYAFRVMYDHGKMFHLQGSYGEIESAGGLAGETCADADDMTTGFQPSQVGCTAAAQVLDSEDYEVWDVGMIYKNGPIHLRAEYIDGENVDGRDEYDEQSWYVMAAYRFNDIVEGVVRYQDAECDNCDGVPNHDQDLDRFEAGLNFFLGPTERTGRLQLNYVSVGGDEEDYVGEAGGSDNRFDAVLGQLQLYF